MASPATIPVTRPIRLGWPNRLPSIAIPVSDAVAAEMWVTVIAMAAVPFAPSALPALKPNQPTQSIAAPTKVMPGLWGGATSLGNSRLGPSMKTKASAAVPAVACTTSPPAKSATPRSASQPPPHIQWATGA